MTRLSIAARQADLIGDDAKALMKITLDAGITSVAGHTERFSQKVAKKAARKLILDQLPNDDDLLKGKEVKIANSTPSIYTARKMELDSAVQNNDWKTVVTKCPIRESDALGNISSALKFRKIEDYEKAVRQLLAQEEDALAFVRRLFGDLFDQLGN